MDVRRTYNGKWELRWTERGRKRSRTFGRKSDAQDFHAWQRRRRQLGQAAVPDDVKLGGAAPKGTRPRDLRSSYVTLRIYEGIPLTQIGREVGTSVRMIELHYAGVIANWDGKQVPAERSIRAARKNGGRKMDGTADVD